MGDLNVDNLAKQFLSIYCNSMLEDKIPHFCFFVGSAVELPLYYFLMNPSDTDSMFSPANIYAMKNWKKNHEKTNHKGATILYIDTSNSHPGFARLRYGTGELHQHTHMFSGLRCRGPAQKVRLTNSLLFLSGLCKFSRPASEHAIHTASKVTRDVVHAILCPVWPSEAMEWKTRKRPGRWPDKDLAKRIVSFGCHFVQKPHASHPGDCTEWRFSFSMAEVILIQSWSSHQKYVYYLLRIIKNQTHRHSRRTRLCTYYIKTLMLWASEEHTQQFWDTVSTSAAIEMMLALLIDSLTKKRCLNYFIPSNNMLDHIEDINYCSLDREIGFLCGIATSEIRSLRSSNPVLCTNCKVSLLFPSILFSLLNIPLFQQSEVQMSECKMMLNKIFEKELHHMLEGICNQVLNNRSKRFLEGCTRYVQLAEKQFCEGLSNKDTLISAEFYLKYTSCEILLELCKTLLKPTTISKMLLQHKTLLYQRNHNLKDAKCNCKTTPDLQLLANTFTGLASMSFPKISYFTCTAFATNLYFNMGNYKFALDVLTDALDRSIPINAIEAYHYIVPVLMVEDWSVVFDNQIQTILGFYFLVKYQLKLQTFVLDRICPLLFLHYLRVQCCWRTQDKLKNLSEYIDNFKQHHISCFQEKYCRLNRSQILTCALRLSGICTSQLREF